VSGHKAPTGVSGHKTPPAGTQRAPERNAHRIAVEKPAKDTQTQSPGTMKMVRGFFPPEFLLSCFLIT